MVITRYLIRFPNLIQVIKTGIIKTGNITLYNVVEVVFIYSNKSRTVKIKTIL